MRTMASAHIMASLWSFLLLCLLSEHSWAAPGYTEQGRQYQPSLGVADTNDLHLSNDPITSLMSDDSQRDDLPHHSSIGHRSHRTGHVSHRDHRRSPDDLRLHDLRRIVHLRDKLDRLHLQQRTDRLRLDNLERALQEMQQQQQLKEQPVHYNREPQSGAISRSNEAKNVQSYGSHLSSGDTQNSLGAPATVVAVDNSAAPGHQSNGYHDNDKSSQKSPSSPSNSGQEVEIASLPDVPGPTSAIENQHKTVRWLREEVTSLQELVQDLGKSCNVTVAKHDKQEVEARLGGLGEGLAILQGGLSRTSAHGEATEALLNTLREEGRSTAEEVHRAAARLAGVEREMASLKENLYDTLASFPDGSFASQNLPENNGETELGLNTTSTDTAPYSGSVKQLTGRTFSRASTSSLRIGLSGVQQSSMQLLQAVNALETRQDTDREQLRREIAKLEFNMSKTIEEHKEELRRYHDGLTTEQNLSADLRRLAEEVETMRKDLQEKNAKQSDAIYRLETLATRFFEFENRVKSAIGPSLQDQAPSHGTRSESISSPSGGSDQFTRPTHRHRGVIKGVPHRRHPHVLREQVRGERY